MTDKKEEKKAVHRQLTFAIPYEQTSRQNKHEGHDGQAESRVWVIEGSGQGEVRRTGQAKESKTPEKGRTFPQEQQPLPPIGGIGQGELNQASIATEGMLLRIQVAQEMNMKLENLTGMPHEVEVDQTGIGWRGSQSELGRLLDGGKQQQLTSSKSGGEGSSWQNWASSKEQSGCVTKEDQIKGAAMTVGEDWYTGIPLQKIDGSQAVNFSQPGEDAHGQNNPYNPSNTGKDVFYYHGQPLKDRNTYYYGQGANNPYYSQGVNAGQMWQTTNLACQATYVSSQLLQGGACQMAMIGDNSIQLTQLDSCQTSGVVVGDVSRMGQASGGSVQVTDMSADIGKGTIDSKTSVQTGECTNTGGGEASGHGSGQTGAPSRYFRHLRDGTLSPPFVVLHVPYTFTQVQACSVNESAAQLIASYPDGKKVLLHSECAMVELSVNSALRYPAQYPLPPDLTFCHSSHDEATKVCRCILMWVDCTCTYVYSHRFVL